MTIAKVYQFVGPVPSSPEPTHISLAPMEMVDDCFSRDELTALFGGYAKYQNKKDKKEWIGIWGARKASQFRRLLKERGAIYALTKSDPADLRLKAAYIGASNIKAYPIGPA